LVENLFGLILLATDSDNEIVKSYLFRVYFYKSLDNYTPSGLFRGINLILYPKGYYFSIKKYKYTLKGIIMRKNNELSNFTKSMRKKVGLTQTQLSERAGVGLRFIREMEQGKQTLQMDKVNQVLFLFGHKLGPVKIDDGYEND